MAVKRPSHPSQLPPGFLYAPDFITAEEESELIEGFARLPFRPFDFQGYTALRRVVEYGWEYDFTERKAAPAQAIPGFLDAYRERAARWIGVPAAAIVEVVITEYPPGAPIGWHRDVPQFETIVGISLGSRCRMRLKPYRGEGKLVWTYLEPRSAYVISGEARWKWQHSIPAVEEMRYSVTFRTAREKSNAK
jgi:alkylated DNA repair dioxygenase AlkB